MFEDFDLEDRPSTQKLKKQWMLMILQLRL